MEIYDTNDSFDFNNLVLTKPTLISGGNYFIRCLVNNSSLYIQPPKCKTKQGFMKAGKRFSCDLMFTNENENFIRWMENLENHCQQFIYKNRDKWFDGEMELHDIENYFTSPLKLYKSGKYYISRVNVNTILNKPSIKIYDENENELDMESINDNTNVVTVVEIQGIKCSSRSFQIEIELKQMMVLQTNNMFEKCIIKTGTVPVPSAVTNNFNMDDTIDSKEDLEVMDSNVPVQVQVDTEPEINTTLNTDTVDDNDTEIPEIIDTTTTSVVFSDGIEEVDFNLEELKEDEPFQIKKRDDVYYEMYREARRKAKIARDLALSSYLEAKRIKNTYMLNDVEDSDDSDTELEELEDNNLDEDNSIEESDNQ